MDTSPKERADESKKLINEEAELEKSKKEKTAEPKVSRTHDFTHTHPSHARHKQFGLDHEPGAF